MDNNYFFVDGSALLGDIRRARVDLGINATAKLNLKKFSAYFTGHQFREFIGGGYRRFVFYFVQDDERLRSFVELPDFSQPGEVSDLRIEYCGKRIPQFEKAKKWLEDNSAPDSVSECLYRSEKAVDTQICCDALQLAGTGKLDRLFLYTNDYDFVPLCRSLRQLGSNVSLFRLRGIGANAALICECDAFHEMDERTVRRCFGEQDG
jgi:uncharacterized LabA/DUF88 family protein